jgi:hypothetical protein
MPLMLSSLYDALLDAGASPEAARKAAEEGAAYEQRFAALERKVDTLTWMVTFALVMLVGILWRVFTH